MNKQNRIFIGVILAIVVLMAIGYAAIGNITMTIGGTASAAANAENFKVYFTAANTVASPNAEQVAVTVTAESTTATVNISGLDTAGDNGYAILEIENGSDGIDASSVQVTTGPVDTTIFDLEAVMCDSNGNEITNYAVAAGAKTYVKISAELKKTPTTDVNTAISAEITAVPAAAE